MIRKFTAIYTEQVGYNRGQTITKKIEFEQNDNQTIWAAMNEAGYKTQKSGYEWDICDAVVFLFYGHVQDVYDGAHPLYGYKG